MAGKKTTRRQIASGKAFGYRRNHKAIVLGSGLLITSALFLGESWGGTIPSLLHHTVASSHTSEDQLKNSFSIVFFSLIVLAGLMVMRSGFKNLRAMRTMADIPTSFIRTGAVGSNVEILGKILPPGGKPLIAPVSGKRSTYYELEIFRKNFFEWEFVCKFNTSTGFFIQDRSKGIAFVTQNPYRPIDFRWKEKPAVYKKRVRQFSQFPFNIKNAIYRKIDEGIIDESFPHYVSGHYRFIEKRIDPLDYVYILGHSLSGPSMRRKLKPQKLFESELKNVLGSFSNERLASGNSNDPNKATIKNLAKQAAIELEQAYGPEKVRQYFSQAQMIFGFNKDMAKFLPLNPVVSNLNEENLKKSFLVDSRITIIIGAVVFVLSSLALAKMILKGL